MLPHDEYDAFISYSPDDAARVTTIAESLREAGLRIWLDEWEIKPGASIVAEIDRGLSSSRFLLLCVSPAAIESEWAKMQLHAARFDDPSGQARRVIPIILESCVLPPSLASLANISASVIDAKTIAQIAAACRLDQSSEVTDRSDRAYLASLDLEILRELVILDLLQALGFREFRTASTILPGASLISFNRLDPLSGKRKYQCAVLLTGEQVEEISLPDVFDGVCKAMQEAAEPGYVRTTGGLPETAEHVYLIAPTDTGSLRIQDFVSRLSEGVQVDSIAFPHLLHLIREYCPDVLPQRNDPTLNYLRTLARRFSDNPALLQLGAPKKFGLTDLYTGGDLSATTSELAQSISFATPEVDDDVSSAQDVLSKSRHAVVIADVGGGKTTLLKKLALDIIGDRASDTAAESLVPLRALVPVYVPLHELPKRSLRGRDEFLRALQTYVFDADQFDSFSPEKGNRFVLFLDGFDELQGHHREVCDHIRRLQSLFPNGVLVTSRPSQYPIDVDGYAYFKLNPFTHANIGDFLGRWFSRNKQLHSQVFERITSSDELLLLCRNPLILTLYTILATRLSLDTLPTRRTDVYEKVCALLLGEWDSYKHVENEFAPELKGFVLEHVAYIMQDSEKKSITRFELLREIGRMLTSLRADSRDDLKDRAETLLAELIYRTCLLKETRAVNDRRIDDDERRYEFAHLSFQEYFAARRLQRLADRQQIQRLLFEARWRNTLVFFFGINRAIEGVGELYTRRSRGKGGLLMEYLTEAVFTEEVYREQIYKVMARDLISPGNVSRSVLETCARAGARFLNIVDAMLAETTDYVVVNYLRMLVYADAPWTRGELVKKKALFLQLNDMEFLTLVAECTGMLRSTGWPEQLLEILHRVKATGELQGSNSDWEPKRIMATIRDNLKGAFEQGYTRKDFKRDFFQALDPILRNVVGGKSRDEYG